jgi:Protein of unknown function (DUF2490)
MNPCLKRIRICISLNIILLIFFSNQADAQTTNQFMGWAAAFGSVKLNNQFGLHLEAQLRSGDEWKEVRSYILRTGLIYYIRANQNATVGYAFIDHHRRIGGVSGWGPEHRIWEQYILNLPLNLSNRFISIQNRLRLEQRFISASVVSGDKLETKDFNFSQRLRYFVRGIFPLLPNPEKRFQKGAFFSLQDEIFVNLGDASATNGKFFDQNRLYFSLGYRFSPKYDAEIGYMYQYLEGRGDAKTNNNILQLAGYFRL